MSSGLGKNIKRLSVKSNLGFLDILYCSGLPNKKPGRGKARPGVGVGARHAVPYLDLFILQELFGKISKCNCNDDSEHPFDQDELAGNSGV